MQTSLTSIGRKRREPGQKQRAEVCWHVRGDTRISVNEGECPGVGERGQGPRHLDSCTRPEGHGLSEVRTGSSRLCVEHDSTGTGSSKNKAWEKEKW